MNLLYDVLRYFSKFPDREAVMRMFNKGKSNYPAYEE